MSGRFLSSETWKQLREDPFHSIPLAVVGALTSSDIEDLLEVFVSAGTPDKLAAFAVLRGRAQGRKEFLDVPWSKNVQDRFVAALEEQVRESFARVRPFGDRGSSVMCWVWNALDPDASRNLLMAAPIERLDAASRKEVLRLLGDHARTHAGARSHLEAIVRAEGSLSEEAREALETSGIVSPDRLLHWSKVWREQRSQEALDWLYYRWLDHLPVGYPAVAILAILGPPTDGELPDVYYSAGEGHVYLELYETTGLSGCHHT